MKTKNLLCLMAWMALIPFAGTVNALTGTNMIGGGNPGFESGLTGWGGSGMSNVTIDTTNPGAGLNSAKHVSNANNNWNVLVNTAATIPTTAGNIYICSALARQSMTGGPASLGLCELTGSMVATQYTFQATSTSGTWHSEQVTLLPRADTAYLRVYLWVDQAASGTAWWDNLRVETLPNPFVTDTNASVRVLMPTVAPTYSGTAITPATLSPTIKLGAGFVGGVVAWKLTKESDGINGTPVLQDTYAIQQSGVFQWPIDMTKIASNGVCRYLLTITTVRADGSETATMTKPVAVVTPPSTASLPSITSSVIDSSGRLSVNGQPFQTVMYYMTTPADFAFQRTNLGANSVEVTGNSISALGTSIDQAWAAGLYSWVVLFQPPFVAGTGTSTTWNISTLQSGINTLKSKPGVLGWVLYDEPDPQGVPASAIINAYNAIKAVDTNHVVWTNFTRNSLFSTYTGCTDLASYDQYPFPLLGLDLINQANIDIQAAQPGKPLVSVLQGFGTAGFPSFSQLRAELYTNVCDGMSQLFYFAWSMSPYYCLKNELEMQSYTRVLNWEMDQLKPFLFTTTKLGVTVSNPNVRAISKTVGTDTVIVLVNQSAFPVSSVTATVSGKTFTTSSSYFVGGQPGAISSGHLVDTLPAYGVGVYKAH